MAEPIVIPPGGGEVVGDSADRRVEILCDHDALHATWSRFGPHRDGADLHVHHRHHDLFYVLRGELTVLLGPEGEPVTVPAGTLARMPPLVVHGFRNGGDEEVRYLNLHAPGRGFADFMRSLRDGSPIAYDQHDPPQDGGRPASDAVVGGGADVDEIFVAEAACEAGSEWPAPEATEFLWVLEGEGAGSWIELPPGATVSFAEAARVLHVRAPGR